MDLEKIIKTKYGNIVEDFYVCDCLFDTVFDLLIMKKKFDGYDKIAREKEKKYPTHHLFLSFSGCAVMLCKKSFQYYHALKNESFLQKHCIPNFISLNGETTAICVVCLIKSILADITGFFKHFRLVDRFRDNDTRLYLRLPVRTSYTTTL